MIVLGADYLKNVIKKFTVKKMNCHDRKSDLMIKRQEITSALITFNNIQNNIAEEFLGFRIQICSRKTLLSDRYNKSHNIVL